MTDVYDAAKRSAVMRQVKGSGTTPERTLRRLLTRLGARYRLNRKDLPGSPDIVLPGRRLVLFAHGCFWHGHDCARGARVPKTNRDYWLGKVARNRARDAASCAMLLEDGWRVEVIWECETKDEAALTGRLAVLLDRAPLSSSPGRRVSAVKQGHKGHEGGAKDTK